MRVPACASLQEASEKKRPAKKIQGATRKNPPRRKLKMSRQDKILGRGVSRRALLQAGAGLAGSAMLPVALTVPARAVGDYPPIGTFPAGSSGTSVFIGISVPRTGTY